MYPKKYIICCWTSERQEAKVWLSGKQNRPSWPFNLFKRGNKNRPLQRKTKVQLKAKWRKTQVQLEVTKRVDVRTPRCSVYRYLTIFLRLSTQRSTWITKISCRKLRYNHFYQSNCSVLNVLFSRHVIVFQSRVKNTFLHVPCLWGKVSINEDFIAPHFNGPPQKQLCKCGSSLQKYANMFRIWKHTFNCILYFRAT